MNATPAAAEAGAESMTAREAEITYCMGIRGIGFRPGSAPLAMSELLASLRDTHTLAVSEEMGFCGYSHMLIFKDNNSPNRRYFLITD